MKKFIALLAVFCCLFVAQSVFAEGDNGYANGGPAYTDGQVGGGCCPEEHPVDQACGECWCKYCCYKPCYYNTYRCVEEPRTCTKRCCRYVPKYYQVQRCRYVPQYYCETCCCQVPEYYDVPECYTVKRWVCDRQCKYVPQYYWKHVCGDNSCQTPCPQGGCQ